MGPVPDTTLRATGAQMRNLMIAALASTGAALLLGCFGWSRPIAAVFAVIAAFIAVIVVPIWLFYLAAYVRLDDFGVTSRLFRRYSCEWRDIDTIRIRESVPPRGGHSFTVRVRPKDGPEFALAVPVDGRLMRDRAFRRRVAVVETAWRGHGGREIAVTR